MKNNIKEVGERIRGIREDLGMTVEEAAKATGVTPEQFTSAENGEYDCSVTFIYKCAEVFGIDLVELLTGENPKLHHFSLIKSGSGLPMKRREGFEYQHLAYLFKDKKIEPFMVKAPFKAEEQDKPISLSSHEGQEFDYVLSGTLRISIDGKVFDMKAGDAVIYNSNAPHGMIAADGAECDFLAILIK
jgi:transcriptional regulator with XRE-family HTH domain